MKSNLCDFTVVVRFLFSPGHVWSFLWNRNEKFVRIRFVNDLRKRKLLNFHNFISSSTV